MASASYMSEDVEPKPAKFEDHVKKMDELKKRAFVSPTLPEDFLRILLDPKQIAESKDNQLARQLQYEGVMPMSTPYGIYGAYRDYVDYGRGRLQIDVVEAKLNKNYNWITRMDPYVRLKVGTRVFETPTCYNGSKNPQWRKSIFCYLPRNVDSITIEIYDEKSFTEDELIAFVKFPLPKSLFDGIFLDEWIPLNGKLGEQKEGYINIQMLFTPIEALQNDAQYRVARQVPVQKSTTPSNTSPSSTASSNNSDDQVVQPSQVQIPTELSTNTATSPDDAVIAVAAVEAAAKSAAPTYTEEDLNSIKDMFPTFDVDVIKSILELNRGNKEAAIEALLNMN